MRNEFILWGNGGSPSGLPRNGLVGLYDPYRDAYVLDATARAALQTLTDYSGLGNTGTLGADTNASTDDPLFTGTSLSFDGGDYVSVASAANLNGGRYSVAAVLKGPAGKFASAVVDKSASTGVSAGWGLVIRSSNPYVAIYAYDTSMHRTSGTVANVMDGSYHVVCGGIASGNQGLFIDGTKVLSETATYDESKITNAEQLFVGAQRTGLATPSNYLPNGSYVSFVAIWGRVLSDMEFARTYRYLKSLMAGRGVTVA